MKVYQNNAQQIQQQHIHAYQQSQHVQFACQQNLDQMRLTRETSQMTGHLFAASKKDYQTFTPISSSGHGQVACGVLGFMMTLFTGVMGVGAFAGALMFRYTSPCNPNCANVTPLYIAGGVLSAIAMLCGIIFRRSVCCCCCSD